MVAIRSISTRVPGTSSPVVPIVVRGGGVEGLGEILEHVAGLLLDGRAVVGERGVEAGLGGDAVLEVAGELTRGEDEVAGTSSRRVEGQRLGNSRHGDVHSGHGGSPLALLAGVGGRPGARENNLFSCAFPRAREGALYRPI